MNGFKHILVVSAAMMFFTACGYRAALHQSYIPEVTTPYNGVRPEYQQLAALLHKDTGMEPTTGNALTLITDGARKLELTLKEIQLAKESIYIEYYRFCTDSAGTIIKDLLRQKAREGLDVRVMIDRSADKIQDLKELRGMKADGVKFYEFYKPKFLLDYIVPAGGTHRDHRKMLIVDGKNVYMGGRNIQDKYFVSWRDADVCMTGPAVDHMARVYTENMLRVNPDAEPLMESAAQNCIEEGGATVQIVPESPIDKTLAIRNCFEWAISNAKQYFWVYSPYTPPPRTTINALKEAARRGVDVRWIIPGVNDVIFEKWMGESLYKELLEAGVRIFEYQNNILHTKQFMTDDYLTAIGSANMDNLSFFLNYEVEAVIYDEIFTRHAKEVFLNDIRDHCIEVTLDQVRKWNFLRQFRNGFIRVVAGPLA